MSSSPNSVTVQTWDKTYSCTPAFFHTPSTEAEIVTIIRAAAAAGQCVKVVGACHSSHDIAFTSGHMVSLRNFNRILSLGDDTVTVEAGCTIKTLIQHLDQHQRALLNLGAICEQALAGAISTGTHGTGTKLGSLGDQVVALRILLADGSIVDCDAQNQSDLFFAARCSLGCLGVLLILTFHTVPQFKLERIQKYMSIDALCAKLPELMAKHERLEWFYEPYTSDATLLIREVTNKKLTKGCWRSDLDIEELDDSREVDVSYKALCREFPYPDLYTEIEVFIPIEHTLDAFREFRAFQKAIKKQRDPSCDEDLGFGVRYVKAEESWLSPCFGRQTAVFSFLIGGDADQTGPELQFELHAQGLENICMKYDCRPHWGKRYTRALYDFAALYPKFNEFAALRQRLDPNGMFVNDYIRRVFAL